jgi:hypothetical protein
MPMTPAEICRRLHVMVDELAEFPDAFWDNMWPLIKITVRSAHDPDYEIVLVVGVEPGREDNDAQS